MLRVSAIILIAMFLTGCAAKQDETGISVYTFEVEREDQDLAGNRGYLMGTPPPVDEDRPTTRTFIGVDIIMPEREFATPGIEREARTEVEIEPLAPEVTEFVETPDTYEEPSRVESEEETQEVPEKDTSEEEPKHRWIK